MLYSDIYNDFVGSVQIGDLPLANTALMRELGNILVSRKSDFVHLLNESNIPANENMGESELIDLFINNIDKNRKLALGTSLLININNKQESFDGEDEVSDEGVKAAYVVMRDYYSADGESEDFANLGGWADAISGVAKVGGDITGKVMEGRNKKQFGGLDMANKKIDAKNAITQQVLAQKQTQLDTAKSKQESKSKTMKMLLIVGGSVVALGIIAGVIYAIKKKK